ncbi:hypothetical protein NKJ73_02605 [Mesorhizobium sp. M0074]|uniref:hypothetical protein n=1 Tax=unclassified Mesorhizobium TaxID=325217 RepID=UPI00333CE83D
MAIIYDSLQFVTFTTRPPIRTAVELWQSEFGKMPDSFQQLPMGAGSQAVGSIGGLQFIVIVQLNRIDVVIRPPENLPNNLGTVSQPNSAMAKGISVLKKLSAGEHILRPAVVFQTSEEFPDLGGSVAKAVSLLPGQVVVPQATIDVSFHTNVPRTSLVDPNVTIQRMYRVANGRRVAVQVDLANPGNMLQHLGAYIATQYVDVFAAPETPMRAQDFDEVLDEIVKEAQLILSDGYDHFS